MASRFELDKFTIEPSAHQLDICRKADLLSIADLYKIQVTRGARKQDIKKVIYKHLVERGVLSEEDEGEAGVADQVSASEGEGLEPKPEELTSMDPANLPSSNPLLERVGVEQTAISEPTVAYAQS